MALAAGLLAALFGAVAISASNRRQHVSTKVWFGGDIGDDESLGI